MRLRLDGRRPIRRCLAVAALVGMAGWAACSGADDETTTREAGKRTMRIEFQRSGGVAGMTLSLSIDTDTLPEEEAGAIEDLVERSDFFGLPQQIEAVSTPDAFIYRVTIETKGRSHTVTTSDIGAPAALSPLLQRLEAQARRTRKK